MQAHAYGFLIDVPSSLCVEMGCKNCKLWTHWFFMRMRDDEKRCSQEQEMDWQHTDFFGHGMGSSKQNVSCEL